MKETVKNLKDTSNLKSKSGKSWAELARRALNEQEGRKVLTQTQIKGKVGAHTQTKGGQKGIAITTHANNSDEKIGYYNVLYWVPIEKVNKVDIQLKKDK